jgi:predicted RNA-binding Zn ribbon-like protein
VGDHLALDLLNTEARSQGDVVDFWTTNEEVHRWLVQHGVVPATPHFETPLDLLARGRGLRAAVRKAVSARKARDPIAVEALNEYLQAYLTTPLVLRDETGALVLTRIARGDTVFSMLGPVAEAAAQLLVEDDFSLIKQCEHPDCILWFYDRTRSHKRRWCSMARCGNRHKAAQFRKRSSAE